MKVCAVLVTYNPCKQQLQEVMASIKTQIDHVVVVDNTPNGKYDDLPMPDNCNHTIITNAENIGLSKAQNKGIQWAIDHGYDYVLILDQDSIPASDMVEKLVGASKSLTVQGVKLAAVGPRYGRKEEPTSSFLRFGKYRCEYISCDNPLQTWVESSFLISSGMFISTDVFLNIGFMDKTLFIDHIDTEWCLRAMSMGYVCYGVCDAYMTHELGESLVKLKIGRERNISLHHPFRLYYIFRNSVLLYKRPYMLTRWKLFDLKRLVFFPLLYLIYSDKKISSIKYMTLGFWHGLLGKSGKL